MPPSRSVSSVQIDIEPAAEPRRPVADPEEPFRILVLGDFSGRVNRKLRLAAPLRVIPVDRDNLDEVIAELDVALESPCSIAFKELDDFHPDAIFRRAELFRSLRESSGKPAKPQRAPSEPAAAPSPEELAGPGLLDRILEVSEAGASRARAAESDPFQTFLRNITEPHLVAGNDPEHERAVRSTNEAVGAMMRALLHHPDFQALEAAWRAVALLVARLETDASLQIHLADISRADLEADLSADIRSSRIFQALTSGGEPWALLIGNYVFELTASSAALLKGIGQIARELRAPLIAEISPPDLKTPPCREWIALRRCEEAPWIGLALPRFLLRLPYGSKTSPIESFEFDEMPETPEHPWYLWGNPAFACAYLLGKAFRAY